jgi:geranylgeranyl pyrophosphate synthase
MLGGAPERELRCLERIALYWGLSYQIVDDLKDVIETAAQSGKTSSRDCMLGRPNMAEVLGVEAATERLARLLKLGDHTMRRMLEHRPGVSFLEQLRAALEHELARVIHHSNLPQAQEANC